MASTNARTRPLPNGLDHSSLPVGVHLPINTTQPPAAINSGTPCGHHVRRGERVSLHRHATSRQRRRSRRRMWRRGAAVLGADGEVLMLRSDSVQPLLRMLHVRYTQASILGIPSWGEKGSSRAHRSPHKITTKRLQGFKKLRWQFAEM